jgi:cardiolipin synthase
MLTAIYNAKDRLILTSPYFVPDESLLIALASAAARGVNTTVILPERNDSVMVRYASRAYYQELLESGVKIAKFQNGLLHTKSVTVDQHLTIFGTVNLDMRSFYLNFELSMLVYDEDFTRRVRLLQQSYLEHCTNIDLRVWENRPFKYRLIENSMRLLGPLL